ncbi:MAG: ABC transporter ATP-binding protein, partial [Gaiellaceae bacterium]
AHPVIRFIDVTKVFRRPDGRGDFVAVDNLSFEIAKGEIVAVLGKTGCGKSTMFNIVAGLTDPTSGSATVIGHNPFRDFDFFRGKIGIVFQNDRLMPWRTAIENVALGLQLNKIPRTERLDIAASWLKRLGLAGHEHDYPHALSGGMRQRVSIARAFAVRPDLLLCDEPFSALDEITGNGLRAELLDLLHETGATSIFITHSIEEALRLGSRILVFERPARIAFEAALGPGMNEAARGEVRAGILKVLAGTADA